MKLHTDNFTSNLHETATAINKLGLAQYVHTMSSSGASTQVVYLMPDELVWKLREERSSHIDPHHDDCAPATKKRPVPTVNIISLGNTEISISPSQIIFGESHHDIVGVTLRNEVILFAAREIKSRVKS